jgi:hypothetical protein
MLFLAVLDLLSFAFLFFGNFFGFYFILFFNFFLPPPFHLQAHSPAFCPAAISSGGTRRGRRAGTTQPRSIPPRSSDAMGGL